MTWPIVAVTHLILISQATAHYVFSRLIVNGTTYPEWKYVRDVAPDILFLNEHNDLGRMAPQYDVHNSNITCGRSAFLSAAKTETADVIAGDEMGFKVSEAMNSGREYSAEIFHEGPAQIYLSESSENLEGFNGIGESAEWFKIASFAGKSDTEWAVYRQDSVNFTIPVNTPPGKYLLRIEQFMPSSTFNYTQWYVNCAHINIIGKGGGSFEGYNYAKFPGTYDINDPGLHISDEMASSQGLLNYIAPGPPVWKG